MLRLLGNITRQILLLATLVFFFLNMQCEDEEKESEDAICDFLTIVNAAKYNNLNSDIFTLINYEIDGDCLLLTIGTSGCDGNSWEFNLVDSGAIAESFPEQRYLKLDFSNEELCLAYFERKVSFNLMPVQVKGSNKIILHIDGLDEPIEYVY